MRVSVRARLTALYGGLFLLAGLGLLGINYLLVESRLPEAPGFVAQRAQTVQGTDVTGTAPAVPAEMMENGEALRVRADELAVVIQSVEEYRASTLSTLLLQSGVALVVAAALAVVLGWLVAGRVLRPVHEITVTARRLGAENLDRRIELDGPQDELKELADTFDGMLDRLASAFDSQRRFVANASHELRTPLAVQRTLVEVALANPDATPELRRLATHLLHNGERSERLIDGLLTLARSDRGLAQRAPVRLDQVTDRVLRGVGDLAGERHVTVRETSRPCTVSGDPVLLERLVDNLVRNAVHYNVPGGSVTVEVGGDCSLVVTNTGPEVPEDEVPGLFEPFRRLGTERVADVVGAGLGLSIVRSVVRAHHGDIAAEPGPGGGLRVEVRLPPIAG
ncbi:sensor histidine kinase [Amycolatopsis palatopharyngis]|uniref:sensor histidine kinase n=1 Tax=Amycolatopsis palatopharyngis TaxID=187982 RepID=UPI000E22E6A9|nr:HAMP domain-containing sensor histidine kinase [Amycolatopsis palatopharyngis]